MAWRRGSIEVVKAVVSGDTDLIIVGDSQVTYGQYRMVRGILLNWTPDTWCGMSGPGNGGGADATGGFGWRARTGTSGHTPSLKRADEAAATNGVNPKSGRDYTDLDFTGNAVNGARLMELQMYYTTSMFGGTDVFLNSFITGNMLYYRHSTSGINAAVRFTISGAAQTSWTVLETSGFNISADHSIDDDVYTSYALGAVTLYVKPKDDEDETGNDFQICGASFWKTTTKGGTRDAGLHFGSFFVPGFAASDWNTLMSQGDWEACLPVTLPGGGGEADQEVVMISLGHNLESGTFSTNLDTLMDRLSDALNAQLGRRPMFLLHAPWGGGQMSSAKRDAMVALISTRSETVCVVDSWGENSGSNPCTSGVHPASLTEVADVWGDFWTNLTTDILTAASASYAWTGAAATLTKHYVLDATAGSVAWTGTAATFAVGGDKSLTCDAGSFSWTGTAASPLYNRALNVALGQIRMTGKSANLEQPKSLTCDAGSFTWTGTAATLTKSAIAASSPTPNETVVIHTFQGPGGGGAAISHSIWTHDYIFPMCRTNLVNPDINGPPGYSARAATIAGAGQVMADWADHYTTQLASIGRTYSGYGCVFQNFGAPDPNDASQTTWGVMAPLCRHPTDAVTSVSPVIAEDVHVPYNATGISDNQPLAATMCSQFATTLSGYGVAAPAFNFEDFERTIDPSIWFGGTGVATAILTDPRVTTEQVVTGSPASEYDVDTLYTNAVTKDGDPIGGWDGDLNSFNPVNQNLGAWAWNLRLKSAAYALNQTLWPSLRDNISGIQIGNYDFAAGSSSYPHPARQPWIYVYDYDAAEVDFQAIVAYPLQDQQLGDPGSANSIAEWLDALGLTSTGDDHEDYRQIYIERAKQRIRGALLAEPTKPVYPWLNFPGNVFLDSTPSITYEVTVDDVVELGIYAVNQNRAFGHNQTHLLFWQTAGLSDAVWDDIELAATLIHDATTTGVYACTPPAPRANRARILLSEEDTYGSYLAALPVRVPVRSESLRETPVAGGLIHSIEQASSPARIGAVGRRDIAGEIITEFSLNGWGPLLLKHATTDSIVTTDVSGRKNHVGTTTPTSQLPTGLSVDKVMAYPDGTVLTHRYLGCRVDTLSLRINKGQATEMRAALVGRQKVEAVEPLTERYYPDDPVVFGNEFLVELDLYGTGAMSVVGNVVAAQFTIANKLGRKGYVIEGDGLRGRLPQGSRRVSGRIQAFFVQQDEDLLTAWLANTPIHMRLTGTKVDDVDQYAVFDFPAVYVRGSVDPQVSGRGLLRIDWSFQAMHDEDAGYDFGWTVQNLESAIHTDTITRV